MGLFRNSKSSTSEVIDLRAASTVGQRWGQPGRCPECGGGGFLDRIDLIDREIYQHCTRCDHCWITTEADLASVPVASFR